MIINKKLCFRCGHNYIKGRFRHKCNWSNGRVDIRCTETNCTFAAATCKDHTDNASQELLSWLGRNSIKFVAETIYVNLPQINESVMQMKNQRKSFDPNPIDPYTRKLCQEGKVAMMMKDDETLEVFTNDMRRTNVNTTIRGVPTGDPVFIFCVFKGKKSNIMTFIDSGANV